MQREGHRLTRFNIPSRKLLGWNIGQSAGHFFSLPQYIGYVYENMEGTVHQDNHMIKFKPFHDSCNKS